MGKRYTSNIERLTEHLVPRRGRSKGFTLIELLIVIAIVGILAVVAFVALDPATRFQDTRDAVRFTDVTAILNAAKIDQVDNGGTYATEIAGLTVDTPAMVGTSGGDCSALVACADVSVSASCVDLSTLATEGYLASVPVAPTGAVTYDDATTGYTITRNTNGSLTVAACESEGVASVSVSR